MLLKLYSDIVEYKLVYAILYLLWWRLCYSVGALLRITCTVHVADHTPVT